MLKLLCGFFVDQAINLANFEIYICISLLSYIALFQLSAMTVLVLVARRCRVPVYLHRTQKWILKNIIDTLTCNPPPIQTQMQAHVIWSVNVTRGPNSRPVCSQNSATQSNTGIPPVWRTSWVPSGCQPERLEGGEGERKLVRMGFVQSLVRQSARKMTTTTTKDP